MYRRCSNVGFVCVFGMIAVVVVFCFSFFEYIAFK